MAKKKDTANTGASLAIGGMVATALIGIAADALRETITSRREERADRITIPTIPTPNARIILDDAKQLITEIGLPVTESVVKADKKYKDCLEFEVVRMNYRPNQKVKPGTPIILYYVTLDVIVQSQELYANYEREKEERKQLRDEIVEDTKQKLGNTANRIKTNLWKNK